MKKLGILLKLFLFLFVAQMFSQSHEIKTVYTMDGKNSGGGEEDMIFKVYSSSIVKVDLYYDKSTSYSVKLKNHGYNEANEYVEIYQPSFDYDNIQNASTNDIQIFYIYYTKKGGDILGVQHKTVKSNKMYFTQYGYNNR